MQGIPFLEAIFLFPAKGEPGQRVREIMAMAGLGLEGDRYALGRGYYSGRYDCEVSLVEGEVLQAAMSETDIRLGQGEHRRNLVTRGLPLGDVKGGQLVIGSVVLEYHRPRPPCDYLQRITQPGMTKALGKGAGIGMRVLVGGMIREGMEIQLIRSAKSFSNRLP